MLQIMTLCSNQLSVRLIMAAIKRAFVVIPCPTINPLNYAVFILNP